MIMKMLLINQGEEKINESVKVLMSFLQIRRVMETGNPYLLTCNPVTVSKLKVAANNMLKSDKTPSFLIFNANLIIISVGSEEGARCAW